MKMERIFCVTLRLAFFNVIIHVKRFFLPLRKIFVVNFKMALTSLKCAQSPEMRTESGNAHGVRKCAQSPEMRTESGNAHRVRKCAQSPEMALTSQKCAQSPEMSCNVLLMNYRYLGR